MIFRKFDEPKEGYPAHDILVELSPKRHEQRGETAQSEVLPKNEFLMEIWHFSKKKEFRPCTYPMIGESNLKVAGMNLYIFVVSYRLGCYCRLYSQY